MRLAIGLLAALLLSLPATAGARSVLVVGNNWDGTADIVDPVAFKSLAKLNIIPDKEERLAEIARNPADQAYFLLIREEVGEGHDQFVDDAFTSHDGRYLYVSRPSFVDVVAIDLSTRKIAWRTKLDGNRADHMAISPDGTRLLVSASTARKVEQLDAATGKVVGSFPSGDQPHENNYSADGSLVFHASIGTVYTPLDDPAFDASKGERFFQVVDARTNTVLKRIDMGKKLEEAGHPDMSSAVRPMAISPDEKTVFFQVSFFHGFVEYDLVNDRIVRIVNLPLSDKAAGLRRDEYLLDSAHHGLSINPAGTKLCAAGTMSDYAAIVDRSDFTYKLVTGITKPYWSTNSGDGKYCFVSASGDDSVAAISYDTEREVARIPVGDHPQRMRMGVVADGLLGIPPQTASGAPPRLRVSVKPRRLRPGRLTRLRVRVSVVAAGSRVLSVKGARVKLGRRAARTNARGVARMRIRLPRGAKRVVKVSLAGYTAARGVVRARR